MRWFNFRFNAAILVAASICSITYPSYSQDFPNRRVTFISPYPPGSGDAVARVLAERLSAKWKRPVIVDVRPGASGILGTRVVKSAPPDGYTILIHSHNFYGVPLSHKDAGYKPSDFVPIGVFVSPASVLLVSSKIPHGSLKEVLEYAKSHPGALKYGSVGPLSFQQIFFERLKTMAGLDVGEVPFKGAVAAAQALWTDTVQLATASVGLTQTIIQQPTAIPIGVTAQKRSPFLPNVPTFPELGYPELVGETPIFALVSADTPEPIVAKLRADFAEALKTSEVIDAYAKMGHTTYDRDLAQFDKEMKAVEDGFRDAIAKTGYQPQ